jgi:hypothetical protein
MFIKRENANQTMLLQFFIMLLVGAVGSLVVGIKYKKWLPCMLAVILFLVLAFQAFKIEVVSGGVTIVFQDIIITWLSWFGAMVGTIFTFNGVINQKREMMEEKNQQR